MASKCLVSMDDFLRHWQRDAWAAVQPVIYTGPDRRTVTHDRRERVHDRRFHESSERRYRLHDRRQDVTARDRGRAEAVRELARGVGLE